MRGSLLCEASHCLDRILSHVTRVRLPATIAPPSPPSQVDAIRAKIEDEQRGNPASRGDYFEHVLQMHS